MFANERHNKIIKILKANKAVKTTELVNLFDVSTETARRDLLELEKKGLLQRVHGGAILTGEMLENSDLSHRLDDNRPEKTELCETAATLVNNGDIIIIDSGSTAIHFAESLKSRLTSLTVVTASIDVFNILNPVDGFEIILCGGHYLKSENTFYGQLTIDMLKSLHAQKGFIFPSALSLQNGICGFHHQLHQIQLQLIASSDNIFFLADSNKFENHALLKLSDMNSNYTYVTDSKLSPSIKELYSQQNIRIITNKKDIK